MIVLAATAQAAGEDYTTIPEALVNTVIAMGTVFLVLILISFIISLLKFIPMLMDTGGNCGSQSSTLIIRGLALGEIKFKEIFIIILRNLPFYRRRKADCSGTCKIIIRLCKCLTR